MRVKDITGAIVPFEDLKHKTNMSDMVDARGVRTIGLGAFRCKLLGHSRTRQEATAQQFLRRASSTEGPLLL